MLHLKTHHDLGTLVTYAGREYDLARRLHVHDLAAELGCTAQIGALLQSGAGQDVVTAALWLRILDGHPSTDGRPR